MNRIYVILALIAVGSAVFMFAPHILQSASHWVHVCTLCIGGHHLSSEIGHAIHPHIDKR